MPTSDSIAVEPTAKYTWDQIIERVGEPTTQDLDDYAIATPASELVEMGNKIRSARILTDLLRWRGQLSDWLAQATPDDEQALGLDRGLLRVAVREAGELRKLTDSAAGSSASSKATLAADRARLGSPRPSPHSTSCSTTATSAVQPVWWLAPQPRDVSPSKYS